MSAVVERNEAAVIPRPVEQGDSRVLMSIIERAATSENFDVAKLQQLLDVKKQWDAEIARKAFVAAMAAFKANPPKIIKDKHVAFVTNKGTTEYDHATLGQVCTAIIEGLAKVGISHSWDVVQAESRIKVTCILTHELGHSERVSLNSAPDESGGKNSIQAIGSAVTYLQRYSLFCATGLAPVDDDDGQKADPSKFITEKQVADLDAKISEVGANRAQFLKYLNVERLADLPASKYQAALQALVDKARGAR